MKLAGLLIPRGWHGKAVIAGERMIPTVGHVRDLLVFALRHVAEAERWILADMRVSRRVDALRRGEA